MNNIRIFWFTIFVSLLFLSCQEEQTDTVQANERIELLPEPDRDQRLIAEAIKVLETKNCSFDVPDTSICGINIRDQKSTNKIIGQDNDIDNREQYHFLSKSGQELLTLTQHPGDFHNEISVFNISSAGEKVKNYRKLAYDQFKSEKGIQLGMSKNNVIGLLGNCFAEIEHSKNYTQLYYRIDERMNSQTGLLERHNMPIYYATYSFQDGILKQFEFGFEYP